MAARDGELRQMQAEVFKALGHPIRLAIVEALRDGPACVCEIAKAVGAERSNVSRHLGLMLAAGVLDSRRDGLMVHYGLKAPCLLNVFPCVERLLRQRLADNRDLLRALGRRRRGRGDA